MPIDWDKTKPGGTQAVSDVDDAIRDTRAGVEMMLDDEHTVDVSNPADPKATHKANFLTSEMIADGEVSAADLAPNAAVPAGFVWPYAGSIAPTGWLECNGAAVSRETYAALFAAIGTTFGVGNGSTTFNVPDTRGEFIRGWDHDRGIDANRDLGSAQLDALQNITGTFVSRSYEYSGDAFTRATTGAFSSTMAGGNNDSIAQGTVERTYTTVHFDASEVARTGDETRPRNVAFMYCIKY
jgi:microcystin-dependent protein